MIQYEGHTIMQQSVAHLKKYRSELSGSSLVLSDAVFHFVKYLLDDPYINRIYSGLEETGLIYISLSNPDTYGFRSHVIVVEYLDEHVYYEVELGMTRSLLKNSSVHQDCKIETRVVGLIEVDTRTNKKTDVPF